MLGADYSQGPYYAISLFLWLIQTQYAKLYTRKQSC